ncbi:hypothetical protein JOD66_005117 [Nocardioides nitrophenolicus]|nr:hypothetical protein [Nocardioides nitrophenolicus]
MGRWVRRRSRGRARPRAIAPRSRCSDQLRAHGLRGIVRRAPARASSSPHPVRAITRTTTTAAQEGTRIRASPMRVTARHVPTRTARPASNRPRVDEPLDRVGGGARCRDIASRPQPDRAPQGPARPGSCRQPRGAATDSSRPIPAPPLAIPTAPGRQPSRPPLVPAGRMHPELVVRPVAAAVAIAHVARHVRPSLPLAGACEEAADLGTDPGLSRRIRREVRRTRGFRGIVGVALPVSHGAHGRGRCSARPTRASPGSRFIGSGLPRCGAARPPIRPPRRTRRPGRGIDGSAT